MDTRLSEAVARPVISFGEFRLDTANTVLTRLSTEKATGQANGQATVETLSLTPKAFDLLLHLIEYAGQLTSKQQIFAEVWTNRVVTDAALTVCVRELRKVLGDDARNPRYIETVSKRGYRFIAPVQQVSVATNRPANCSEGPITGEPFVGREAAITELHQFEDLAVGGHRQVVFIAGEPGIGKSTMIAAYLAQRIPASGTLIAMGQCIEQYGSGEPYMPILDAMGNLSKSAGESLVSLLEEQAPTLLSQLPALSPYRADGGKPADIRPERLLREITDALETLASKKLLILVLEDVHWSDLPTLELLSFLAIRQYHAKLLVIVTYRPTDAIVSGHPVKKTCDDLRQRQRCRYLELDCLNEEHVSAYLLARFPVQNFPPEFSRQIQQKSHGNPLFMVNLLAYMRRQCWLKSDKAKWYLSTDTLALDNSISDDIQGIINQQLEQLKPNFRAILEAASIASEPGGMAVEFTLAEVAAVLQLPDLEIENDLDWLARNHLFVRTLDFTEWPDGTLSRSYRFIHALYQNVLYDRVSLLYRTNAHKRLSQRIEEGFAPLQNKVASRLAVHFELSRQYTKALYFLIKMAEVAASRGANRETIATLEKSSGLLEKIKESTERDRLEISALLLKPPSIVACEGNATPSIEHCYKRALQLCERIDDQPGRFRAMFGLRSFYVINGELEKAYKLALALLNVATGLDNKALILEAHVGLASSGYYSGDHAACHAHALKGIALYDPGEHGDHALTYGLDPGVFCRARASQTSWILGLPDQALNFAREAVELAKKQRHTYSLVLAIHVQTQLYLNLGDAQAANKSAQLGKRLAEEHEFSFLYAWALFFTAWALALAGKRNTALQEIELARQAPRSNSKFADSYLLTYLAETYLALNMPEEGLDCLSRPVLGHSYDAERGYLETKFRSMLIHDAESPGEVIALGQKSLDICRRQGAKIYELKTAICLAELFLGQSDEKRAIDCLLPLVSSFKEGLELTDIKSAGELVQQLTSGDCTSANNFQRKNQKNQDTHNLIDNI